MNTRSQNNSKTNEIKYRKSYFVKFHSNNGTELFPGYLIEREMRSFQSFNPLLYLCFPLKPKERRELFKNVLM